jgi:hypothetical protein
VPKLRLLWLAALLAVLLPPNAGARAVPACAPRAVLLRIDTNGAGGRVLIYASLVNRGRNPCVARGRLGLRLRDPTTKQLLQVTGNPFARTVSHRLRPGRNILYTLEWRNYCGPVTVMRFELTFWTTTARTKSSYPAARCDDLAAPSRLRLIRRG